MDDWRATYEHHDTPLHRTGRVDEQDPDPYFETTRLYSHQTRPAEPDILLKIKEAETEQIVQRTNVINQSNQLQRKRERTIDQAVSQYLAKFSDLCRNTNMILKARANSNILASGP